MDEKGPVVALDDFVRKKKQFQKERLAHRRKQVTRRQTQVWRRLRKYRRMKERTDPKSLPVADVVQETAVESSDAEPKTSVETKCALSDSAKVYEKQTVEPIPRRYHEALREGIEARAQRERLRVEKAELQRRRAKELQEKAERREFHRHAHLKRTKRGQPLLNMQVQTLLQRLEGKQN
jgi:hypothetical protein